MKSHKAVTGVAKGILTESERTLVDQGNMTMAESTCKMCFGMVDLMDFSSIDTSFLVL